jgi:hypothetical protein
MLVQNNLLRDCAENLLALISNGATPNSFVMVSRALGDMLYTFSKIKYLGFVPRRTLMYSQNNPLFAPLNPDLFGLADDRSWHGDPPMSKSIECSEGTILVTDPT